MLSRAYLEGHANNAHCLAAAVNTVLCALFALSGRRDTEERLKEFLAVKALHFMLPLFSVPHYRFGLVGFVKSAALGTRS